MNKKTIILIIAVIFFILYLIFLPNNNMDNTDNVAGLNTDNTIVVLQTNLGDITLEIYTGSMPITGNNFVKLVKSGFYDNVIFHRVIPNFMIQGGDPTGTGTGGPGYKIADEFTKNNSNTKGTIAMANSGPNTGGSQFFINVFDNTFLDNKHPVFGKVISGYEIAESISNVERDGSDKPLDEVVIIKAFVKE
jgi:peptidylprolyl isomerase